ncbi:AbrB/MazE/SpoVT family DNA-binding domain-containing protein [Escherichia coli]
MPENVKRVEVIAVGLNPIHYACRRDMGRMVRRNSVSADFMDNREQPGMQERESF